MALIWRRGWDLNPRGTLIPAGFQDRCLQPLGHPSVRPFSRFIGLSAAAPRPALSRSLSLQEGFCVEGQNFFLVRRIEFQSFDLIDRMGEAGRQWIVGADNKAIGAISLDQVT
jgi:hypothetical protein